MVEPSASQATILPVRAADPAGSVPPTPSAAAKPTPSGAATAGAGDVNVRKAWTAWSHVWRANRGHLVSMLIAGLLVNIVGLTLPLFTTIIYDRIVGNGAFASLWALAIGMGIGALLDLALRQARAHVVEHVGARWDRALDERVYLGMLRAPLATPPELGPVLARYRDVLASRDFLSSAYLIPAADLPFVALYLGVIWLLGGPLVSVALGFGLLLMALSLLSYRAARRWQRRMVRRANEKVSLLAESIAALETLRRPRSAMRAIGRFVGLSDAAAADSARVRVWHALPLSAGPALSTLATVGTLVTGVYLVEAQMMTTGALVGCSMLVSRCVALFGSVAMLANRYGEFTRAVEELGDSLDLSEARAGRDLRRQKRARLSAPEFSLSRVGFKRQGSDRAVLDDVSLQIPPKQFVALLGRSGAGKSTMLRLLAGRLSPTAGTLVAGGVPIDAQRAPWLAGCVGYKAQDPQFLGMTVGDLLADSGEHATPAQRLAVLRRVGLERALATGELSLATRVGPFGGGVSGGQRQMLALACALLQGDDVLLLDEPTLGLDSTALGLVVSLLAELKGTRTIVIATHATEIIDLADRLIVVGDGRVLADGPRDKLIVPNRPAAVPRAV